MLNLVSPQVGTVDVRLGEVAIAPMFADRASDAYRKREHLIRWAMLALMPHFRLRALSRITSHSRIPFYNILDRRSISRTFEYRKYAQLLAQSRRSNLPQIWAREWEVVVDRALSLFYLPL